MSDADRTPGAVSLVVDGPCAWIIIDNQPRMNALNVAMWREIPRAVVAANSNPEVRILVFRGAGEKAFSAGADISEFGAARTGAAIRDYDNLNHWAFEAVLGSVKPTLAMIGGFCLGGGLELALCCDMRIAADNALFGIPAARLGIGYNARWIRPLLASMTATAAKELLFTGERFTAGDALRMGLVNRVVPAASLQTQTDALAGSIAANAPLSIRAAKAAIDEFMRSPSAPDYARLDALTDACFSSEDYEEGRKAFAEKRKPVFKGR